MNIVAEREWREASDMRRSTLTLAGILGVAAFLRFWRLGSGIPYGVEAGELELVGRAVAMMRSGEFDPQQFPNPGFYVHLQLVVATIRFLTGATAGAWQALDQPHVQDFLLWARTVSALAGTLTVLAVFRVAMRWGTRYAMLAGGLLAVMPLHVRESQHAMSGIPLTLFVTVALLLSLRAHEVERATAFAAAGAAAGLAAATQYAGALAVFLPLLAAVMTPSGRLSRGRALGATFAGALMAFILAAPYVLLNLPGFLNGAAGVAARSWSGGPAAGALAHYLGLLRANLHWPALLLAVAGLVLGLVRAFRGPGRVRWTLAVLAPSSYLWFLRSLSTIDDRLLLPIVPLVCVLAAAAVVSGVSFLRRFDIPRAVRTALIVGLTIAALLPPLVESIGLFRARGKSSTTALAYEWVLANAAAGALVVTEPGGPQLPEEYRVRRVQSLLDYERADYLEWQVDLLVASSPAFVAAMQAPHERPAEYRGYMTLLGQARELARFTPDRDHPGSELRIYALR